MTYDDCQKIVDAVQPILPPGFTIEYYLDAEPFILKDGEMIEITDLPKKIRRKILAAIAPLKINF